MAFKNDKPKNGKKASPSLSRAPSLPLKPQVKAAQSSSTVAPPVQQSGWAAIAAAKDKSQVSEREVANQPKPHGNPRSKKPSVRQPSPASKSHEPVNGFNSAEIEQFLIHRLQLYKDAEFFRQSGSDWSKPSRKREKDVVMVELTKVIKH